MKPAPHLIDRREVMAMFPKMTLRKFKRTKLWQLLKIHAVILNRNQVFFPASEVVKSLKVIGYAS